jgi:cyclic-di-GMP-binding protein
MARALGLSIPELTKADKDAFDLRPRKVDEWLNSLPRANVGETARQVFETLVEVNRYQYSYQHRIHFLEALRETTLYVTDSMKRHFVGVNAPLPAKSEKIASASREIHYAMAIGYMIAIEDLLQSSLLFSDHKLLAMLIQRAISALGMVLLTSYQTFHLYPPGIWSALHKLYAAAEQRKLLQMSIVDEQHAYSAKTTINADYIRLFLLALTSPYRLRHGEVGKVFDVLARWVGKCRLNTVDTRDPAASAKFGVDLSSDAPPRAASLVTDHCNHEFCRIMDSIALTNAIRKDIKHGFKTGDTTITGIEMTRSDLSQELMKRLLVAWCIVPRRSFPRNDKQENVQITLGLTATHQIIITGTRKLADVENLYSNTAQYHTDDVSRSINDTSPDVWDMIYFPTDTEGFESLEAQLERDQANQKAKKPLYQAETWLILNESARGYCIKTLDTTANRAQVGEIVGVRRDADGKTWKWGIGVIRWLRADDNHGLMLGIEMLTPDAAAIGIRAVNNARHDYQRTLMLPELKAVNQPTTLITSTLPYRVGQQFVINILGKEILVKLTKQLQNTGLFSQFQFEITETQTAVQKPDPTNDEPDTDFDGVWNSI